jgi:hypothetical protein
MESPFDLLKIILSALAISIAIYGVVAILIYATT